MHPDIKAAIQISVATVTIVLVFIIAIFVLNQYDSDAKLKRQIECIDAGGVFDSDSRDCVLDQN